MIKGKLNLWVIVPQKVVPWTVGCIEVTTVFRAVKFRVMNMWRNAFSEYVRGSLPANTRNALCSVKGSFAHYIQFLPYLPEQTFCVLTSVGGVWITQSAVNPFSDKMKYKPSKQTLMPQQFALSAYHSVPFDHSSCTSSSDAQHCHRERTCKGVQLWNILHVCMHTQAPQSSRILHNH